MKSVAFYTLGCKVNQYETDAMNELFEKNGYEIRPFDQKADIYIINTCTVTNMADRKSRQILHRAKKKNPEAVVVAVGCYVQAAKEVIEEDPYIDVVVGNNQKKNIIEIVEAYEADHGKMEAVIDIGREQAYESLSIHKVSEHTRAYIKIQDGCNQFCSYCIIPYARGRVRSRQMAEILEEVRELAKNGYKEIVLTGIHISSYGIDLNTEDGIEKNLISLLEALNTIDGIERIRLGSLEPRIITEAFLERLVKVQKICPHFHLSLQSGCDETLKRMNRHYTAREYLGGCTLIRKYFDRPSLTTDVIVGFPGETNEEFEATKAFIQEVAFADMHIFKYSKRQGTKAAVMENQVDEQVKTKRSNELIQIAEKMKKEFHVQWMASPMEVLFEEEITVDEQKYWVGHSKAYIKAAAVSLENLSNQIRICQATGENSEDFMNCKITD